MTKLKPAETKDLTDLLTFPDSASGEAVIEELKQRLRNSESAFAAHRTRYGDAAAMGFAKFSNHLDEAQAFERASAHISLVLECARKRLVEVQQTEREKAGAKARSEAFTHAESCGLLLRELLDQAKDIAVKLARWNAGREEVNRLNSIASAGGAEPVLMPELLDDAEAAAEAGAEAAQQFEGFLKDHAHVVYARRQRAQRVAEAEQKKLAETPTEHEANALRASKIDLSFFEREPTNANEHYLHGLARQALSTMRKEAKEGERLRIIAEAEEKKLVETPPRVGGFSLAPTSV